MTRHFLWNLVLAVIVGLGLFGILAILTDGVPFQYYPSFCFSIGCGYQPLLFGVDLLFWVGLGFALVSAANKVSEKWGEEPFLRYHERTEIKFLIVLLFFGSAIFSIWASLRTGAGTFGWYGWYIDAMVFAVSGSIVLMLPVISRIMGNDSTR